MGLPKEFLWGTSLSAYQVEGGNKNADWWHWELRNLGKPNGPKDRSGKAANFWELYKQDLKLAKKLKANAIRLSIEWSRIFPRPNKIDRRALTKYTDILRTAKNYGLYTLVTLYHFTLPLWFARRGGFENKHNTNFFLRYLKTILPHIDRFTDALITINEPIVYTNQSYLKGRWPPQKRSPTKALTVLTNLLNVHKVAYQFIKKLNSKKPVTIVFNIAWFQAQRDNNPLFVFDELLAKFAFRIQLLPLYYLKNYLDYLGINYYFTNQFEKFRIKNPNTRVSDLGWWLTPQNIYHVLKNLDHLNKPIIITENGLADSKDKHRPWFIKETAKALEKAKKENVKIKGYLHWSLLDNFEWTEGFSARFGLIEVDYKNNFKRKPRRSYYIYREIIDKYSQSNYAPRHH